jgi:hypothetical protein
MFLSFNLQKLLDQHHGKNVGNRNSILLIVNMLKKIEKLDASLYESSVLAVFSRLIYFSSLRTTFAESFVDKIPRFPSSCVSLLIILVHSGQKQHHQQSHSKGEVSSKSSVRSDCLHLLAQSVRLNKDESSSSFILNYLLSCCLSDDFEIRSKVIGCVVSQIYDAGKQAAEDEQSDEQNKFLSAISSFAVQSLFFSFSASISSQLYTDYLESCSNLEDLSSDYSFFAFLSRSSPTPVSTLQESFSTFFHGSLSDNLRKSFHLIEQLALVDTQFLCTLAELYCFSNHLQTDLSCECCLFLYWLSFISVLFSLLCSVGGVRCGE